MSFIMMAILLIPGLIISLIIIIDSPGASPIYVQTRVGKNGKPFRFFKFRSMVAHADAMLPSLLEKNEMDGPAFKMKDDPRITKFGKFIRKTSIDELPQLLNIFCGKMSFVGPRPPLPREVEQYNEAQRVRLSVTPGLTCYWQVQPNRNSHSFDEWVALDLKYIEERSLWVDLKIMLKTFKVVFGMGGI
jgi:lipopolysaccharide/colanic/teichoic acid biosynthesis glycosyltransferase